MGYLDNTTATVDVILTKLGRMKLAQGLGLGITKFALSDDEINYSLYNPAHPKGSAFYGSAIENMPLTEAPSNGALNLRYKLATLPRGTRNIPIISLGVSSLDLTFGTSGGAPIRPNTTNGLNSQSGYTAILMNGAAATLTGTGVNSATPTIPAFLSDSQAVSAVVAQGLEFTISANNVTSVVQTTLMIIGNETGASVTIPVTIRPRPV